MAQFNSLTDRVRQMLGGIPQTLSDIGNRVGSNISLMGKIPQAVQQFVQQPDKFNQTLAQNIKRPGLGVPLTIPSFVASNTINATGNLLQKGIPSALKIGSYISPGLSAARMSGVYPQLNAPVKGSDVLNIAGLAGIPKVGANIIGGGIGTTFKVGENALMRKPLDQGLGEAYRQGYQFSAQLTPVEKLTSWIASPTIKALSNKFPVFNKVVNKLTPGEVKDFTTWVTESLKQGNKSGLAMSVFGALQDSKNGQETLKNIWDQYRMGFVFGAGGKAVGNLKPGVIDPLREKLKPMTLDQKVANQGGFVKLAPGEKPTLEQLKADIANQAKNKPNGFNPIEDIPGTRPGLRAEFDNAIARQDVETIQKLLPEVPEAYKKQVGKYLDPILNSPLRQEAKKYKSAEEFVKAVENTDIIVGDNTNRGFLRTEVHSTRENLYPKIDQKQFALQDQAKKLSDRISLLKNTLKFGEDSRLRTELNKTTQEWKDISAKYWKLNKKNTELKKNADNIYKSQLTDIWNQANKQPVKPVNVLYQPRSEKVAQEMLKKGTIDTPKYNEIAGREGFPVRQLQQQGQQAKMLEPIAKQDKQMAMAEAELRAGIGADIGLTNQDRTKLGQLKKMFERADKEQGAWDVESLKKNNKTLVNWATERWRELGGGTKDNLTDDEIINEVYDFLSNNQLSGKLRPNTPSSVKTLQQMKEDQKAVARLTGYGEDQYSVRNPKPMTLSDAEKQAKLHEQAIEQTYKTRDASVDELEALLRTPDAELKGGYKIEKGGGQPTFPIKGKGDDPKTFRGIINKYFGGKQNIKLTQYEQVKPIANVKFTDDGAKQAIRAIESGDTANLTPQAQEYVTNLRKSFDQVRSEAVADGLPIGYVDNYLTHYWQQDPATVQAVINKLRTSGAFQKERTFLTYQEGIDAGLTPRFQNPTQILGNYVRQVENVRNNLKLVKALEGNNFIVSGDARKITPGVREIAIPGFDGKFAKPEIAQFIENLFEPRQANKILSTLGNISGKIQDVTLSGGIPGTPFNAFSISANLQKHFLAGRFTGPVKSFARAFSPESTTKYFNENIPAIREIQGAGYNLPTTLSYNKLMGDDTTGVGKVWNMAVSDPTFKRFIPMLQIDLYKEVKNKALKQGLSAEQAVEKGIQVLKNFEGMSDQFSRAASDPNAQAAIRTVFFAPKFRKAIIDIWVNSIKALKNPLALENQYNVRFLAGSILAFAGYNAANAYFNNGKMMWENGRNKEDKLIIPDGKGGQIGIPFLSSLATIPRGIARQALKVAKGDVSGAATDAGQTYLSSGIKPIADVAANQDYFGKTISPPDSQNKWGDILKYLGKSYASHPYIKELIDPANMVDPAYQRLSRAMELPFRFYDKKSVEGSKYYEARDKALEGMNEIEKKAYDAIPKYDANNPNTQIFKYQTFLTYPNVFEAKRMTEFNLAKQTGKPIDPLYLVNYDTAKAYMRYETLPPGSQDRKDLVKAKPELAALFDVRSKYFDENPIEGQTTSNRPLPSAYVQQQMDAKNWKDPQVRAYLDANTQYQNEQRAKLGLTPLAGFTPYAKKPKKVSIKLAKMKTPKIKSVKIKLPKIKKPKTLKLKKYTVKLSK